MFKALHDEFGWFIWGLVGLAFIWFFTGGAERQIAHDGVFLKPPAPLNSGQAYGNAYAGSDGNGKTKLDLPEAPTIFLKGTTSTIEGFFAPAKNSEKVEISSILAKKLSFDGLAGVRNSDPGEEYIRIIANEYAKGSVSLASTTLRGTATKADTPLPKAVEFLTLGVTALKTPVSLTPNARAIVTSGRSPVGTSFRVNMCTGYLGQFQTYTPALRKECPSPSEEIANTTLAGESACVAFVQTLPRCRIYQGKFPSDISSACKVFVSEKLNYNTCAIAHKTDADFYKDEWRLFLDQSTGIWKNSAEIIRLLDNKGNTIDALSY
ncbi:MAG: hypothetical protein RLZZ67_74 [Candidatus Parcubacteria bacterium]|jgi:hypothetical protein